MSRRTRDEEEAEAILRGERLLPLKALCERWHACSRTIRRYVDTGRLPAVKLSRGKLLFRVADVVEFERGGMRPKS